MKIKVINHNGNWEPLKCADCGSNSWIITEEYDAGFECHSCGSPAPLPKDSKKWEIEGLIKNKKQKNAPEADKEIKTIRGTTLRSKKFS
ncbi:MAG: hypothetical protein JSW62_05050 [Thermoplasmatales archaeon]|nr:MAG: hypothetical protein JSW62_05050 [Thermoplasmatales archaeon]